MAGDDSGRCPSPLFPNSDSMTSFLSYDPRVFQKVANCIPIELSAHLSREIYPVSVAEAAPDAATDTFHLYDEEKGFCISGIRFPHFAVGGLYFQLYDFIVQFIKTLCFR